MSIIQLKITYSKNQGNHNMSEKVVSRHQHPDASDVGNIWQGF